ncbi:MAG: ComEC/Rec2 family competence protein [Actinobacteria bacterium]|nr:ComEC/Rec2 family competence protein [Actinomycetota bacterium]
MVPRRALLLATAMWPPVTAIGCLLSAGMRPAVPIPVAGALLTVALLRRGSILLSVALIVLCGSLAAQADLGRSPLPAGAFAGTVQLLEDPSISTGITQVDVRSSRGQLRLVARAGAGEKLAGLFAGDRVSIDGSVPATSRPDTSGHLRARLQVRSVGSVRERTPAVAMVSGLREAIGRGAASLPTQLRPLYLGIVIGDDRGASREMIDEMRASGLAHLSVVSGENLLFLMILLSPVLRRLGLRHRIALIGAVVMVFASITRFQPSILRASAMALVAAVAISIGRPTTPVRILGLAVVAALLCDPLLVESLGFRLSVAATAGIVLLAAPVARRLPGPRALAVALAVPIAAQLGVAPITIPMFGPQPLSAIPANVLAEPAAAFVMMWGCSVGVIAGLLGGGVAGIMQLPVHLALRWIVLVARTVSHLPSPTIDLPRLLGVLLCATLALLARRRRARSSRGHARGARSGRESPGLRG